MQFLMLFTLKVQQKNAKPDYDWRPQSKPFTLFRGADIFTYMKAKRALPESSCFTLDTNYRSHSDLIAG